MKKIIIILIICVLFCASSCSEAARVNHNISKQAQYFECERRVTVYNARTDKCIMMIEGYINIETTRIYLKYTSQEQADIINEFVTW